MNAMKNKIKSQKGASITFALLLFLVCAVISSVVIVAATAVGGRASQMAELDQRYYAVNSAAELLRDVLEEQSMTVTTGTTTVSTVDQDENPVEQQKKNEKNETVSFTETVTDLAPVVTVNGEKTENTDSLITTTALLLSNVQTVGKENVTVPTSLALTAGLSGTAQDALGVTIVPSLDVTNLKLYITITNTTATKGAYTLGLTFKADIVQNKNERTTYSAPLPTTDKTTGKIIEGQYTRTKTVEETVVSTISWKMIDLQTIYAVTPASTTEPTGGE